MKDNRAPLHNDDHKGRWLRVVVAGIGIIGGFNLASSLLEAANTYPDKNVTGIILTILGFASMILGILVCVKRRSIADFIFQLFRGE